MGIDKVKKNFLNTHIISVKCPITLRFIENIKYIKYAKLSSFESCASPP